MYATPLGPETEKLVTTQTSGILFQEVSHPWNKWNKLTRLVVKYSIRDNKSFKCLHLLLCVYLFITRNESVPVYGPFTSLPKRILISSSRIWLTIKTGEVYIVRERLNGIGGWSCDIRKYNRRTGNNLNPNIKVRLYYLLCSFDTLYFLSDLILSSLSLSLVFSLLSSWSTKSPLHRVSRFYRYTFTHRQRW